VTSLTGSPSSWLAGAQPIGAVGLVLLHSTEVGLGAHESTPRESITPGGRPASLDWMTDRSAT